ncbi:phage tail protein [Hyphomicrobium sp.]|uniref:phage tail protein n=1 Tax=Hyphomicrobium sp. TaxID=82 RepID=UPI001E17FAB1|nr:phage tail protein [Hyphomicrobium sp.]MBY0560019.1 phage tail protein [Hyphomicrobium sp.]
MALPILPLLMSVGGMVLQMLFAPKPKDQYGPRLSDLNVPAVSPGNPIIRHWGTMKLTTQVIWVSHLIETKHVQKAGGKGGMMGGGPKQITYTYSVDIAHAVCAGPVHKLNRIWANQKLLWVHPDLLKNEKQAFEDAYYAEGTRLLDNDVDLEEASVGAFFFAFNNYEQHEYDLSTRKEAKKFIKEHPIDPPNVPNEARVSLMIDQMLSPLDKDSTYRSLKTRFDNLDIYLGYEDQQPNSVIEGYKGVGFVSGFRGVCYFVVQNLQLEDFGNAIPQFQVEVVKKDGTTYLHEIVTDLCLGSGLENDEFNATCGLPVIPVLGFAVTNTSSARSVLEDLQKIYPFDGQETSYVLRFDWIERRPRALIRREDFAAHISGEDVPSIEDVSRTQDLELPKQLNLKYQEPARAYSANTVKATRQITISNQVEDYDIAIALSRVEAKSRIEDTFVNRLMARRTYKIVLPRKYVVIEPGDPVLVPEEHNPNRFYGMLVTSVTIGANGVLEFELADHHYHTLVSATVESDTEEGGGTIDYSARTYAYMLDCPLLTDTEKDNPGYYVVMSGARGTWQGGTLLVDVSSGGTVTAYGLTQEGQVNGSNWYTVVNAEDSAPHGFIMNQLGPAVPGVWDVENKIMFWNVNQIALSSVAKSDLIQNAFNLLMVGDELIQFANATDKGNGVWQLDTLLRGLRGTDWAVDKHLVGERCLRLTQTVTKRVEHDFSLLNKEGTYEALSFGDSTEDVESFKFTNTGNSFRPYTPNVKVAEKRATDFYMRWIYRARQNGVWTDGVDTALDQPYEKYEIDVMNGATVVRTVQLIANREWTYTEAMQVEDFGEAQNSVTLNLFQMGEVVGRGFKKVVTIA